MRPHLSSHLTVVLVHGAQRVSSSARRHVPDAVVDELAAEPGPVLDVVRAAAPVPALLRRAAALQPTVAATLRHVALTAGARDGVDQPRRHHRIDERRFFGSYNARERGRGQCDVRGSV